MRTTTAGAGAPYVAQRRSTGPGSSLGDASPAVLPQHEASLGLPGPDGSDIVHSGQSPEGQPSSTPSDHLPTEDDNEDTEISEDASAKEMVRSGGRSSALVKRKTTALMERMAAQQPPSLAQGVNELLNLDIHHLKKRGRGEGSDSAAEPEVNRRHRRQKNDDFNASSLIGSIFMRVQGTKAPAPLVYFEEDINAPQWFKESIDGVQPVLGSDDFDPEQVNLESMGKLVEGNVLPATLGEVAAYFTHVLGDPRTNKEITPRVLIAIQCDRAKGWFTYKRDNDNSNFVPVVLCAAENGRGLEEVSPAHFEVHRAQCAQKKWRQSFKVLGAQKLHKVTSLAQAALGDVLRHLERILGADPNRPPPVMPRILDANGNPIPAPPRILSAAQHPTFRQPSSSEQAAAEEGIVRNTGTPREREMVPPRPSPSMALTVRDRGPMSDGERDDVRRLLSSANTVEHMRDLNHHNPASINARIIGHPTPPSVSPGIRPPMVRPTHPGVPIGVPQPPMAVAGGSRMMVGGKPMGPVLRRHTDDAAAAAAVAARLAAGDHGRGLDLLATAASTAITSPRGGAGPTGVQASLLAAALSGVSFNELLSLVIDNTTRKQQHQQQAALLQQLAALQAQAAQAEKIEIAAAIAGNGVPPAPRAGAAAGPSAAAPAAGGGPAVVPPPALSRAECQAIDVMIKAVRGPDITHAVRGILQHVAMQYAGEQPADVAPALAEAVHRAAVAEGLTVQEENVEIHEGVVADPETIAAELEGAVAAAAAAAQEDGVAGEMEVEEMDKVAELLQ